MADRSQTRQMIGNNLKLQNDLEKTFGKDVIRLINQEK